MAKLEINGRVVEVDDGFLKLSPADQQKTVEEISSSFSVSTPPAAAPALPVPGDTWADPGGNQFQIIEPTAKRGLGQLTPTDVQSRLAVKPMADPIIAPTGPTEMRASTPEMRAADALATQDPKFVASQLAREPAQSKPMALGIMGSARGAERGPLETFGRETVNTALIGAPRLASSIDSPVPTADEHEMQKAADAAARGVNPKAAKAGNIAGIAAQLAATPSAAFATPARSGAFGGVMSGAGTAIETRGDPVKTVTDTLLGAAAGNVIGRATGAVPARAQRPVVRTNDELRQSATQAYERAEQAGVAFTPQGMGRLFKETVDDLTRQGYHPKNQPGVQAALEEMEKLAQTNVTLKGVDILRQVAKGGYDPMKEGSNRLIDRMVRRIDDFVENPRQGEVLMGDAQAGSAALREARATWSSVRKSEMVDQAVEKAERRAASGGSGGNIDNAIRQNIRGILDSPKKSRGFTEDERAAMEHVVRGGPIQNLTRLVGKLSPSGNGLMMALNAGAAGASGGMSLPVTAVGVVAKTLADRATPRNVEDLSRLIRGGGQSVANPTAQTPVQLEYIRGIAQLLAANPSQQSR